MSIRLEQSSHQTDEARLRSWAMRSADSRGRQHPVRPDRHRTAYQRDRDRIVHSAAFRKLEYKTQVYVIHEGDYYRTRLTHTLEVAQIARTLARRLGLNPDLTEAIALAHDLGHTPFGHSGEMALDRLLADRGGFEHNRQSLRVVDVLEERHHDAPGLNLTWEVREGIAKHATPFDHPDAVDFDPDSHPTLEAQVCDLADEIAYCHHDLDDAMKMGLVSPAQLRAVPWAAALWEEERAHLPEGVREKFVKYRVIGRMMNDVIDDVMEATLERLEARGVASVGDVRRAGGRLVDFSPAMRTRLSELREFLLRNVYEHPRLLQMRDRSIRVVSDLFHLYRTASEKLPEKYRGRIAGDGLEQVLVDYISGMTDRFCLDAWRAEFAAETAAPDSFPASTDRR